MRITAAYGGVNHRFRMDANILDDPQRTNDITRRPCVQQLPISV